MADQVYKVRDPSGVIREIRGPAGASDEDVIKQAQTLFAAPKAEEPKPKSFGMELLGASRLGPLGIMSKLGEKAFEGFDHAATRAGEIVNDKAAQYVQPEIAAGLGTAANVGMQAIPMIAGGEVAKLASPAFRAGAESLMQSALKPGVESLRNGNAAKAIQTMLDEGINVSKGGVDKLKAGISSLNNEIMQAIKSSPATVDKNKVASELLIPLHRFEKQVTPGSDVKAIQAAWDEFVQHPLFNGSKIPVQLAQEMKQGTYGILKGKYGEVGSASTEAQKALARGLKNEIAAAVPEVSALNARESALINALQLAERRALVDGNKNPAGLALLAHNPGAFAAFMADRSSAFKSNLARILNSGQQQIPANTARLGIAGYMASED